MAFDDTNSLDGLLPTKIRLEGTDLKGIGIIDYDGTTITGVQSQDPDTGQTILTLSAVSLAPADADSFGTVDPVAFLKDKFRTADTNTATNSVKCSWPMPDNSAADVQVTFVGKVEESTSFFVRPYEAAFVRDDGGAPTGDGHGVVAGTVGGNGLAVSATIVVVGNNIVAQVNDLGQGAVQWSVIMRVQYVSTI